MHSKDICSGTVIFLGAGFARDLEFPVMTNFISASDLQYAGLSVRGNENKEATPVLLRAGDVFKKFRTYSSNVSKFMNIDPNNMEDIFCLADIIKVASAEGSIDIAGLGIDEIITNIRLWLWKIFQQCPPINSEKQTAIANKGIYERFFRFLLEKHKNHTNISVVTTNYDLMPEFFINDLGGKCTYKIHPIPREWNVRDDSTNRFVHINCNDCIPIYKLHGSVNYFFEDEGDKDAVNVVTDKLNVNGVGRSHAEVFRNRPSLFPLDAITEVKKRNNGRIPTPAVIPPMYSKIESMEWLKSIWHGSLMAIRDAKIIVFVGYSFPQSDAFMKSFFQAALVNRKSPNAPIIINLDKNKDIKCTYGRIFANIDSDKFVCGTFAEQAEQLMGLIDDYSIAR